MSNPNRPLTLRDILRWIALGVACWTLIGLAAWWTTAEASEWRLGAGATLLDGGSRPVYTASHEWDRWYVEAGGIGDTNHWAGGGRVLKLGDVDLTIGGVWLTRTTDRVSRGANFAFGLHTDVGPVTVSLRHVSNGAQTFGHGREPNTGENWLSVTWRFGR